MKVKFLKTTFTGIVLFISCLVNIANAEVILIDTDNDSFIDTTTGLEWMDFGINNNYTYNFVASQLGEGGSYEGWSLATSDQVLTMWTNAFIGLGASIENTDYYGTGQLMVKDGNEIVGSVFTDVFDVMSYNTILGSDGMTATGAFEGQDGLSTIYLANHIGLSNDLIRYDHIHLSDHENRDYLRTDTNIRYSTMLVKTSSIDVPEPTTFAVFALGLMGLGIRRFKKQ